MKHNSIYLIALLLLFSIVGCATSPEKCSVVQYGSGYLTYSGKRSLFDDACRKVLHDISHKIEHENGTTEYPFYGEGAMTTKDEERLLSMQVYLMTKDSDGNSYKITTIFLGNNDPVVMIEDTSPKKFRLINALNDEFVKRGIKVTAY